MHLIHYLIFIINNKPFHISIYQSIRFFASHLILEKETHKLYNLFGVASKESRKNVFLLYMTYMHLGEGRRVIQSWPKRMFACLPCSCHPHTVRLAGDVWYIYVERIVCSKVLLIAKTAIHFFFPTFAKIKNMQECVDRVTYTL